MTTNHRTATLWTTSRWQLHWELCNRFKQDPFKLHPYMIMDLQLAHVSRRSTIRPIKVNGSCFWQKLVEWPNFALIIALEKFSRVVLFCAYYLQMVPTGLTCCYCVICTHDRQSNRSCLHMFGLHYSGCPSSSSFKCQCSWILRKVEYSTYRLLNMSFLVTTVKVHPQNSHNIFLSKSLSGSFKPSLLVLTRCVSNITTGPHAFWS